MTLSEIEKALVSFLPEKDEYIKTLGTDTFVCMIYVITKSDSIHKVNIILNSLFLTYGFLSDVSPN